jgi:group II intron reverse transcriptase/maturase
VKPSDPVAERSGPPASAEDNLHPARAEGLWEEALSRANLSRALQRVEANRGAPGVDGMEVAELRPHLHAHWPAVRQRLDEGTYRPQPVRRVQIPKPGGGKRDLGVPTVLDRLIQQAIAQALTPVFDPGFSDSSFGFRPRRSAHMAVETARRYVEGGLGWVVDVDLDRFFDRVNHDALMARVARKVGDRQVLELVRRYLDAGVMADGVVMDTEEGTPQGSPLSPLLANVMLDDLDKELERRGHRFVRYADDVRVYVASERAATRVLESLTDYIERRLKLRVNRDKSGVARATKRGLLGFGFFRRKDDGVGIRVDPKAMSAMKARIRALTARCWGVAMEGRILALNRFISGWCAYFALAETPDTFDKLDRWLRRRLRQVRWREWHRPRTRVRNLRALGIPQRQAVQWALSGKGSWRLAGSAPLARALPNSYWRGLGFVGFEVSYGRIRDAWRTAGCGPACPVVWEGAG